MILRGEITNPPDSAYGLWYYPSINRFADEDGNILHDLHEFFDVWQLDEWKKTKDYGLMVDRKGNLCELYYLDAFDEEETEIVCTHECGNCRGKLCEIYDLWRDSQQERGYL